MNSFLVKLLYPKKYIRVLLALPGRRVAGVNVVPNGESVTIGERSFLITNDSPWMKTGRNVPCYVVVHNRLKPLDLYVEDSNIHDAINLMLKKTEDPATINVLKELLEAVPYTAKRDEKSPEDQKAFIDSDAFKRLARRKHSKDLMVYLMIGAVILIGGFYMIYTKIQEQNAQIAALQALIEALGA